jgi:hypothetical protein
MGMAMDLARCPLAVWHLHLAKWCVDICISSVTTWEELVVEVGVRVELLLHTS